MKNLCAIVIICLLSSCTKYVDNDAVFTYVGYMRSAEDSTLYTNTDFVLLDKTVSDFGGSSKKQEINFSTNADGYFVIKFKMLRGGYPGICWPGDIPHKVFDCPGQFGNPVLSDGKYIDYGNVYIKKDTP